MPVSRTLPGRIAIVLVGCVFGAAPCIGRAADKADDAHAAFASRVGPLVARYCHECHSGDSVEGDVNLASFATLADMRKQIKVWQRVAEVVGKMETGRVLDYSKAENRQLSRLYLSMMEKMGRREKTFGDATEPLAEV